MAVVTALLASTTVEILTACLVKGGGSIAEKAGKGLYDWVSAKLSINDRQEEIKALTENPENERVQGRLEVAIEDILKQNKDLVSELEKLVEATKSGTITDVSGTYISNSTNVNTGNIRGRDIIFGNNNK